MHQNFSRIIDFLLPKIAFCARKFRRTMGFTRPQRYEAPKRMPRQRCGHLEMIWHRQTVLKISLQHQTPSCFEVKLTLFALGLQLSTHAINNIRNNIRNVPVFNQVDTIFVIFNTKQIFVAFHRFICSEAQECCNIKLIFMLQSMFLTAQIDFSS